MEIKTIMLFLDSNVFWYTSDTLYTHWWRPVGRNTLAFLLYVSIFQLIKAFNDIFLLNYLIKNALEFSGSKRNYSSCTIFWCLEDLYYLYLRCLNTCHVVFRFKCVLIYLRSGKNKKRALCTVCYHKVPVWQDTNQTVWMSAIAGISWTAYLKKKKNKTLRH